MQKILSALLVSNFFSAVYVYAEVTGVPITFATRYQNVIEKLIPLLVSLAVVVFFWFLVNFIWLAKDYLKKQQKSLKGIWMSILALFVMVSIWGIVELIVYTIDIESYIDISDCPVC